MSSQIQELDHRRPDPDRERIRRFDRLLAGAALVSAAALVVVIAIVLIAGP